MLHILLLAACTQQESVGPSTEPGPSEPALVFDGPAPSNILMISIDTFRKDHFGSFGDVNAAPFLSQLADEGVLVTNHQQCSNWTWHSTSCTLNGRYAEDIGHFPVLNGVKTKIPEGQRTLARILSTEHNFGSVLVSNNSWLGPRWGNAQGYNLINPRGGAPAADILRRATSNVDQAMVQSGGDRWLAHAHLLEPHAPYIPPEPYLDAVNELPPLPEGVNLDTQTAQYASNADLSNLTEADQAIVLDHMRLRYEAEIRWMDDQVAQVFSELESQGMLDDTLVVVWTDHGEAFFEHGVQTHANHLYAEENNAVLFFWSKNLRPVTWEGYTHAIDIVPTVLHALDIPIDADMPGFPVGTAPVDRIRFASSVARQGLQVAAFKGDYKLLYQNQDASYRFYDMRDPEEQLDLFDQGFQPIAEELMQPVQDRVEEIISLLQTKPDLGTK